MKHREQKGLLRDVGPGTAGMRLRYVLIDEIHNVLAFIHRG